MDILNEKIQEQFNKLSKTGKLYKTDLTSDEVYDIYINSFSKENNPVFRDPASSYHNCNHCKNFIRRYGNIVALDENYEIVTLFDFDIEGEYSDTVKELSKRIKKSKIKDVFFETYQELNSLPYEKCSKHNEHFILGLVDNVKTYTEEEALKFGKVEPNETRIFKHIHLRLPKEFVDFSGDSIATIKETHRSNREVFNRGMVEIPLATLELVRDLIIQGSILNAESHKHKIVKMIPFKDEFDKLSSKQKDNWSWEKSRNLPYAKFKNELIGKLCTDIALGVDLNKACLTWNKLADKANYMRAVAPFTERQKQATMTLVKEKGYTESFNRKHATKQDVDIENLKHINNGDGKIEEVSIFDNLKPTKANQHKKAQFDNIDEIGIDKFMTDILPSCTKIEAYLENRHDNHMVNMVTSVDRNSKHMFNYTNNFSLDYNGNLAGKSMIKETVKSKGGKVDGVLRFSIMWAEGDGDNSDLDLHCIEPDGLEIYFSNKKNNRTGGNLDVDITQPLSQMSKGAVENITYPNKSKMPDGVYKLFVRQFAERNSKGFKAEIEIEGEIYTYECNRVIKNKSNIQVAEVTLKNGVFSIKHILKESNTSKTIYNLETKKFHTVNLMCLSPNHWGENNVGDKHYLFMLDKCKNDNHTRSYHIENFNSELTSSRKVLEPLALTIMLDPADEQLAGIGYNATVRDELIVKLHGTFKRIVKIKF